VNPQDLANFLDGEHTDLPRESHGLTTPESSRHNPQNEPFHAQPLLRYIESNPITTLGSVDIRNGLTTVVLTQDKNITSFKRILLDAKECEDNVDNHIEENYGMGNCAKGKVTLRRFGRPCVNQEGELSSQNSIMEHGREPRDQELEVADGWTENGTERWRSSKGKEREVEVHVKYAMPGTLS